MNCQKFLASLIVLAFTSVVQADLIININAGTNLSNNAPALQAFQRAAGLWTSIFSDDIVINIDGDLSGSFTNPNVIGSASSVILQGQHNEIVNQMKLDSIGDDDGIVAFLPSAAQVSWTTPTGVSTTANISGNKANLKALGFTGLDTAFGTNDATITFNSNFNFDYDNSDGVQSGLTDFETVAAHEIGHALGFTSIVDLIDQGFTSVAPRILDLFRFETGFTPSTPTQFTNFSRSIRTGVNEAFSDADDFWRLSTGVNGDGRQASHWKADELTGFNIGIMDPTLGSGAAFGISDADIRALDLMGYDFVTINVPEPSSLMMFAVTLCFASRRRRLLT